MRALKMLKNWWSGLWDESATNQVIDEAERQHSEFEREICQIKATLDGEDSWFRHREEQGK